MLGALAVVLATAGIASLDAGRAFAWERIRSAMGWRTSVVTGDTIVLYGPHTFSTPNGSSTASIESFTLTPGASRRYLIEMQKGAGSLTTANVSVNGMPVASAAEFHSTGKVTKLIELQAADTISATLAGASGATLTVRVLSVPDPSFTVFGVKRYIRPSGSPVTVTDEFNVSATAAAPYYLHVVNGPDGTPRASAASIAVNGTQIASTAQFNQQVAGFVETITLQPGVNTVAVSLASSPGVTLDVRVTATDVTAPTITVAAPQPNAITRDATVAVTGTVQDETPTSVLVNGQAATLNGTSFSATAALASEGSNTITVRATDAAGHVTDSTRAVIRDTEAPTLAVNAPAEGLVTKDASIPVSGTVSDATAVTVNVNGAPLVVTAGALSGSVALVEGTNVLSFAATDAAGNVATVVRQVRRDTEPPALVVSSPIDGSSVNADNVTVSGTVVDSSAVTVTANGTTLPVSTDGSFSGTVALVAGPNTITVIATDAAANTSTVARQVTRASGETIPPDPSTVAPALDLTSTTTIGSATAFLYTASSPIQRDVTPGTISPVRAAVIRGRVLERNGTALPGVRVSVRGHPELGHTLSRADGAFDLAVNGGGQVVIDYEKAGYLPAQRAVDVPWQDFAHADDVSLVTLDTQVTQINFVQPIEVAQGSVVTDLDGARRATLMFAQGTQATMTLPNGTTQPLSSIHVRATEYTVGLDGPRAMPAELPPASAYTYAVELSADEAIAAGATGVQFSQPVAFYLENFLFFPIGSAIPVGFYDREKSAWVSSTSGRVVKILANGAGRAELDVDGSGLPADAARLAALGITDAEREEVLQRYQVGQVLWRAAFSHFSTVDMNVARRRLPTPAINPTPEKEQDRDSRCGEASGSIIECQDGVLGERLPVVGTGMTLNYRSSRQEGYIAGRHIDVEVTPAVLEDTSLIRAEVEVSVAGRLIVQEFSNAPGQRFSFTWDGKDAYGRPVQGDYPVTVAMTHFYPGVYSTSKAALATFGAPCQPPADGPGECEIPTELLPSFAIRPRPSPRGELRVIATANATFTSDARLGARDAKRQKLGGWSLSEHHSYDPVARILHLGDGTKRSVAGANAVIQNVLGTGTACTAFSGGICSDPSSGDGNKATQTKIATRSIAIAADGSVYSTDANRGSVRRVRPDGIVETVAGNGGSAFSGDGGPATAAGLDAAWIELGPDGTLYIADEDNHRIRHVDRDGIIRTVAGNGTCVSSDVPIADGSAATGIGLCFPERFIVGPDGSIFIAFGGRVLRRNTDGSVITYAGTPGPSTCDYAPVAGLSLCQDDVPATAFSFGIIDGLALGPDGSLYVINGWHNVIQRITPDGRVRRVIGDEYAADHGDGGPALDAELDRPEDIVVDRDGVVYFNDQSVNIIRRVDRNGIITTYAGSICSFGTCGLSRADDVPARQARLDSPQGLAFGPDGLLYVADIFNRKVRRIGPPLPGFSATDVLIASDDGTRYYQFSATGRHLKTFDARTNSALLTFAYDPAGLLSSITDADGNATRIERDDAGEATAIVAPLGKRTQLELSPAGYLSKVTNPADETTQLTHSATGLLATLTDPRQGVHSFSYNTEGLLDRDDAPGGFFQTLTRNSRVDTTPTGNVLTDSVTRTTTMGRTVSYVSISRPNGQRETRVIDPAGLVSTSVSSPNDSTRTVTPTGMATSVVVGPDPRFGMAVPIVRQMRATSPGGLTSLMTSSRRVTLQDVVNPLSLATQIDSIVVNGRVVTSVYDAATRTRVTTSAEGRQTVSRTDSLGRIVESRAPREAAVRIEYGPRGLLTAIRQAGRAITFDYDSAGRVKKMTDPLGRSEVYAYDSVGRLLKQTLFNGREFRYTYDANGNLTALTPPGRPSHHFTLNAANQDSLYTPPTAGLPVSRTAYTYNTDRQLTRVLRPDSHAVNVSYDPAGRVSVVTTLQGQNIYSYNPTTGNLASLSSGAGGTLAFTYDGSLPKSMTWSGPIQGSVGYSYDNNFRVNGLTINGANSISLVYDRDNLLTAAGALTISRDPLSGRISGTTLGGVTTARAYDDSTAALTRSVVVASGDTIFHLRLSRDSLDRITRRLETIHGVTRSYVYRYDSLGRLGDVEVDGGLSARYSYDDNGNRLSETRPSGISSGTYDDQDRMLSYGAASYVYGANGEYTTKIVGADTTLFTYDVVGNLTTVRLPNDTTVEYVVDGLNRRIAKKVNGSLVQGLIYYSQLAPAAELNATNQVVSRFVYATRANVPDFIIKSGTTYRVVTDHLGSVRLVVNAATGAVAQRLDYDEFGRVTLNTNPGFQPFGFAGGLYDELTGLVRFGARDYDAAVGRWTAKDPLGFGGGSANLYSYAANNPVNLIDPSGLFVLDLVDVVSAAYDLYQFLRCPTWAGAGTVGIDLIAVALPGVIAPNTGRRVGESAHEAYKRLLRQAMSAPAVKNADLEDIVQRAYRANAKIGSGSTAAAIRHTHRTGEPVGGSDHLQKGEDLVRELERWLRTAKDPGSGDVAAAENMLADLIDALTEAGRRK